MSTFNYKIDSLGIFGNSNYLSQAAKSLTNGNMIAGLKNYDERLFQELIIKNLEVKNDIIAIGSSRAMKLRKRFLSKQNINFFNHSVSGASLEDYIAILGIYEKIHGYLPATIILGIDPWVFNKYNNQNRWKTLKKYYDFEIQRIHNTKQNESDNFNITKWKQLINYDYTISNIKFFKSMLKNKGEAFYITNTIKIDEAIKDVDGSIYYSYKLRYPNYDEVKHSAIAYAKGNVYSLTNYNSLNNIKEFEDFIQYLKSRKINIIFFLHPYNPITYDLLQKNEKYQYINISEEYLNDFSTKNSIQIKGSFNPHRYEFKNEDFSDGMHGHEKVAKEIFKQQ